MDKEEIYKYSSVNCTMDELYKMLSQDLPLSDINLLLTETPNEFKYENKKNFEVCYVPSVKKNKRSYNEKNPFQRGIPYQKNKVVIFEETNFSFYVEGNVKKIIEEKKEKKDKKEKKEKKEKKQNLYSYNTKIEKMKEISQELKIALDSNFWYIKREQNSKIEGPFSSSAVMIMFLEKKINDDTFIKPLDFLRIKGKNEYKGFIQIKSIDNERFILDTFEINPDVFIIEQRLKDLEKEEQEREAQKAKLIEDKMLQQAFKLKEKEKEKELEQEIEIEIENEVEKKEENADDKIINEKIEPNKGEKLPQQPEKKEVHYISTKKGKKKKMMDLDFIKTGFYNLSEQERNFSEIYIRGETTNKKK